MGSNTPRAMFTWVSNSLSWLSAARSSMLSSSPLCSPEAIMCSIMGGKILVSSSALRRLVPSRTRSVASPIRWRAKSLESTSPEIFIPSSSGTALALRMLKVRAKRAVLRPRLTRPMTGRRSTT